MAGEGVRQIKGERQSASVQEDRRTPGGGDGRTGSRWVRVPTGVCLSLRGERTVLVVYALPTRLSAEFKWADTVVLYQQQNI